MSTITSPYSTIENETAQITQDEIFDVLSNQRRICVLQYLHQTDQEMIKLREVVDYVAACEHPQSEGVEYQARKSVYTALRQTHLPRLDEYNVIDFNKSRGEIRLADRADRVQMYLEYVPENDISWHAYYLGLTALSGLLLASTLFDIYPLAIGWNTLAVLLFLMLGLSTLVHNFHIRRNRFEDTTLELASE